MNDRNMIILGRLIIATVAMALLCGCSRQESAAPVVLRLMPEQSGPTPWTHLRFNDNPEEFQFAIISDRTGRHRPGIFEKGIEKLNLLRPEFVMSVGDLIEGYTRDRAELDQQWDEIEGFIARLEAPFFYVPGNHDMSNEVQAAQWRQRFGPAYYHFVYRDVLFLCLNTYDPVQQLSSQQIAYVRDALRHNPHVRWTLVFMHEPLWDYAKPTGWSEVEQLLQERPYTVFAGHYHSYTKYVRHDRRYFVLATTGGGLKKGLGAPELGSFDHVTWVTMLPDGPRLANIELDGIHDEDIRTEEMAKLINHAQNGEALQISPVLTPEESFDRGQVTLRFINESPVPMNASGTIADAAGLRAVPQSFDVTVPANSSEAVTIELQASEPTAVEELKPLSVQWAATYLPAGRASVRVPREDWIAVERILPVIHRRSPVVIDGQLDEWAELPLSYVPTPGREVPQWGGEQDSTYRFAVEYDDEYVYVAVQCTDDQLVLNHLKDPWSQDGIEIRLDARPDPTRSLSRGRGEFKEILVISLSPGETPDKMVHYNQEQQQAGVKAVCVPTDIGHVTEVAIPAAYLDDLQGGRWTQLRLNVAVNDFDDVSGPLRALWWRPDWRSPLTYSGSGTFERK